MIIERNLRRGVIEGSEKFGITVPREIIRQLDEERGDIPRSIFVQRALENYFKTKGGKAV